MFTELHAHSAFSFGAGAVSPERLAARAAEYGYHALALTDTSDLGGSIRFTLEAERVGVKPIVGAELLIDGFPTVLLARDAVGYRNLSALVSSSRVGQIGDWRLGADRGSRIADERIRDHGSGIRDPSGHFQDPRSLILDPSRDPRSAIRDPQSAPIPTSSAPLSRQRGHNLERRYAVELPPRGYPQLTFNDLAAHSQGLYCLTGPSSGELSTYIRTGRTSEAVFALERWRAVFGERLAIEVQLHHAGGSEAALASALIEIADRSRINWVATNEPYYLDGAGRLVHDLLTANRADVCVNTAASWGLLLPNGEWRLKSPGEMATLWKGREAGLEASCAIADDCAHFDLHWLRPPLPHYPNPAGYTDDTYLRELAFAGARTRWGQLDERQTAQLDHELGVIARLGFSGFFLVMHDAIDYARKRGILCQGRGSAANSAVAYCLSITAVDPVRHGLLFERFLSEVRTDGRTEAPDIDVDFEMHRREEVLDYMYDHYSRQHAAITSVTQLYHAPTATQDMMRALGYEAQLAFACSKRMGRTEPSDGAAMLREGLAKDVGLNIEDAKGRALLASLEAMDDLPRLRSTHPGGFVLSCEPLGSYLPIEHTTMGRTIIQFDKDDLDAAGVPKFDFLGLGGLSAIHLAFDAIEQRTGEKLELYTLPVDDEKTYEMIAKGDTVGTFQIESRAQIQSILQTKPDRLYDIVVQVALIRPGPIQAKFVHPYTERRRGRQEVQYAHPALEPIVRRTYGVPIFQEQAMAIAMALGGFSAAQADELRRAMGHFRKIAKLQAALEKLRIVCIARGVDEAVANQVVEDLHSFANYGFPESHAWSFALIAYATAWLKANYPTEFFLGMLNAWPMGFYPPATLVHDAVRHDVIVLPPCMKVGQWDCTLETGADRGSRIAGDRDADAGTTGGGGRHTMAVSAGAGGCDGGGGPMAVPRSWILNPRSAIRDPRLDVALRIGWRHIRGLGEKTREALQSARRDAPFTSIEDVVRRAKLTRAEALHIARAGAFEAFQPGRRKAAWEALRAAGDLLPLAPAQRLPFDPRELSDEEMVFLDYIATGISTKGHPMQYLRDRLNAAGVASSKDMADSYVDGDRIVVAGLVVARQHPETAKGTVFLLLEDEFGYLNIIVSKNFFDKYRETIKFSTFLVIEGRLEREDQVINVIGRRFRELQTREIIAHSRDFH
ncbi:MAG: error-prone DNA polymerase [Gemmatimonadota bacterium]